MNLLSTAEALLDYIDLSPLPIRWNVRSCSLGASL